MRREKKIDLFIHLKSVNILHASLNWKCLRQAADDFTLIIFVSIEVRDVECIDENIHIFWIAFHIVPKWNAAKKNTKRKYKFSFY